MAANKKYFTEEERIKAKKERQRKYYLKNKERRLAKQNEYYKNNKDIYKEYYSRNKEKKIEYQNEYKKEYDKTPMARANKLLGAYKAADRKRGRGEGDLTARWIVENIFTKPCAHCGKTGWKVIGCNRLDNSKPHTMDNVEPCCYECNVKLNVIEMKKKKWDTKLVSHCSFAT